MKVRDLMTSPAISVPVTSSAAHAAQSLVQHGISGLPVVDEEGSLVGLVTEADLLARETHGTSLNVTPVASIMTGTVAVAHLDDEIEPTAKRIVELGYRLLPVVDGRRVVGVVARRDLLRHCNTADREIRTAVGTALEDAGLSDAVAADVSSGIVTLTGEVPTGTDRRGLHELISLLDGVLGVDDRLSTQY